MQPIVAQGCLALSMALVGSYVALSKPLVAALPVFLLAWLRFAIGALAMLHWLRKPADEGQLDRQTHAQLFMAACLGNFLFSIFMLYGMGLSSATAAGVIMSTIPAAVAALGWLWLGERLSARMGMATVLAVIGIATLSAGGHTNAPPGSDPSAWAFDKGHLLLLGAVLCEASYAVIGKRLAERLTARRITALINLWGLALMTPLGLWSAIGFDWAGVPLWIWGLLVFYALAASVWSVWLWMTGLRGVSAGQAGIFTVMLPISATLVGVLALNETINAVQASALGLALLGLMLATWPGRAR
jgi:drug/metabolite transporter (DMT)-like permease